jgi:5-formyltetrahydrofolate cyclo-ligase
MTKKELRKITKEKLSQTITPSVREKESERICSQIIHSDDFENAPLVLAYAAMDDEVDLRNVIEEALKRKKQAGLPRIIPQSGFMNFYCVTDTTRLQAEKNYGIKEPEPLPQNFINPEALPDRTLILVPGRAFTLTGERLGRGKGFYDRWLSKIPSDKKNRVRLYGVCFPQQIVESIPCDEHDIKMTRIIY